MPLQTFRYVACGGGNTVFDIMLFSAWYNLILKKQDLHLGSVTLSAHIAALFLSFPISFSSGFYLNRFVVFKESGLRKRTQLYRFVAVNIICILLNFVFLKIFVDYLGIYPTPAKVTATVIIAFISYMIQTHFFFKVKQDIVQKGAH